MARIPKGLCWSRHLTDPLQPYKGCRSSRGKQMHLSIKGRKQDEGGLHGGDKFKGNTAFIYLPKSVGQLTAPSYTQVGLNHKHHTVWMLMSYFPSLTHAFHKHYYISSVERSNACIRFACSDNIIGQGHYQAMIVTTVLNQSEMDTQLSSSRAKQEAYWAELQRANKSLREDLPAGLEPTPLGIERSVVSSMPPNEMHRVIWLTICILLQASRACDGDARPDMKMSCRCIFTAHEREATCSRQCPRGGEISNVWLKRATSSCIQHGVVMELVNAEFHYEDAPATSIYSFRGNRLEPL